MKIRNMSPNTQSAYVRAVKNFSLHFGKSPDKLTLEHVREYQLCFQVPTRSARLRSAPSNVPAGKRSACRWAGPIRQ
jgi:Phage integrase, N-terminal SAM-like domain